MLILVTTKKLGSSNIFVFDPKTRHYVFLLVLVTLLAVGCQSSDSSGNNSPASSSDGVSSTAGGQDQSAAANDADGSTAAREPSEFVFEELVWQECGQPFTCADLSVPLDHSEPDGELITLALVRVSATANKVGTIFVNPGGPGASGVDFVRNGFRFDGRTMANYDLVGFDPRGVGASTTLGCEINMAELVLPDASPDDEDERAALDRLARSFADSCRGDRLLPHLRTEAVAADLDVLRRAVGDDQLNFYGLSYGTLIGLIYADSFPETVGRLAIDGVVDPTLTLEDLLAQQAAGFDDLFHRLAEQCGDVAPCPEGGALAAYDRLAASLEESGPTSNVGTAELEIATILSLYSESFWPIWAQAMIKAETASNFDGIRSLSDTYHQGASFPVYAGVECIDTPALRTPESWDQLADRLTQISPRFGAPIANELRTCAHWAIPSDSPREPVAAPGANPILVIGTTNDAATPYLNAENVAASLERAHLVQAEGDHHTAYRANQCVQEIVSDFFFDGSLPDIELSRC